MKCQTCGAEIPYDTEYLIMEGELDGVVKFQYATEPGVAETEYYCDPECFVETYGGDSA